jgi:hypothetical protein
MKSPIATSSVPDREGFFLLPQPVNKYKATNKQARYRGIFLKLLSNINLSVFMLNEKFLGNSAIIF